jgi:peptidoglycan/LPS O-acetylase OafA/YrhL
MTKTATAVRIPTARRGPAGTSQGTFRRDVEGLRAVAAGLVVLFHAGVPGLAGGYIGVDVFFVISGYLITSMMLREAATTGRISLIGFYGRRARRILPVACLVLVAVLLAAGQADRIGPGAVWCALFASDIRLATQVVPLPLEHFWSLALQVQFYLVWPVALMLLLSLSRWAGTQHALPFVLGCTVGGSLAWSVLHAGTWSSLSPAARAWELGAGALLALAGNDRHRIPYRLAGGLSWLGLVLIVAGALVLRPSTPLPGFAAVVPVLGAVLVLAGRGDGLLGMPPLQWLGRVSYPLYLWHWPVQIIAERAYGGALPVAAGVLVVALGVVLAATTYALVEQPIRRNARLRRSPALTLALSLVLIAAPLAAAWWNPSRPGAPVAHVRP